MSTIMNQDAGIDDLFTAWADAFRRKDVESIIGMLTEDYMLWAPAVEGISVDGLRPRLASAFSAYDIEAHFEREERIVSGDLAFERGWDVQQVTPRTGGNGLTQRQHVFMILRRDAHGVWRFARGVSQ